MKEGMDLHQNELVSSLTHLVGALFSVAGLVLLLAFSSFYGSTPKTVGFAIFGAGLILLYSASALYHFISREHQAKAVFKKIDYAMIYVLIASTYTPLMLAIPERGWGWALFGVAWGLAALGMWVKFFVKIGQDWFSPTLFIIMGWVAALAIPVLLQSFDWSALAWLIAGGVLYTVGVGFFALEKKFPRKGPLGMHEIFHLFVLAGSFAHFWFMFRYVLYI